MEIDGAEWRRLSELYAGAQTELSRLLTELSGAACAQEDVTFERAWNACEVQRRLCCQIRERFHDHLKSENQLWAGSFASNGQIVENL